MEQRCATCRYNDSDGEGTIGECGDCYSGQNWAPIHNITTSVDEPQINIKLVHSDAKVPEYAMPGDAGMDFAIVEDAFIPGKSVLAYPTGIIMEIPNGFELELRPRSSFPFKYPGVFLANSPGTIDSQFRGEIKIILYNSKAEMQFIPKGTRIVQGIIHKVYQLPMITVGVVSETERGSGGMGSTGSN